MTRPSGRFKRLERRVRAFLFHRGDRFECPLCGGCYGDFLPGGVDLPVLAELAVVGGGWRANARCPRCRSTDRERGLTLYLRERTDLFAGGKRVLHVAPEPGLRRLLEACANLDYLTADLHDPSVAQPLDIQTIPFESARFDVILCNHVLEHVADDARGMGELLRVLRPGGWAILQVPIATKLAATREDPAVRDPRERERVFGQSDHVRLYAERDYLARLSSAGFRVEPVRQVDWLGPERCARYALLPEERIFRAERPRVPSG